MRWEHAGKFAIRRGDWIISKVFVDGIAHYGLWFKGKNMGYLTEIEKAKRMAVDEKVAA